MTIDEIEKSLSDPSNTLSKHQKRILSDTLLLMKLHNATNSDQVPQAELVAVIQKEIISD